MQHTFYLFLFIILNFSAVINAQSAYEIKATIDGFEGETAYLAFRYADKTYAKDTADVKNGQMVFEGKDTLSNGVYLILMPPENKWIEFLVTKENQHFSLKTSGPDFFKNLKFEGSKENEIFNNYKTYINEKSKTNQILQTQIAAASNDENREKLNQQQKKLSEEVTAYQDDIIKKNKGTLAAKFIRSFQEIDIPDAPLLADGNIDSTFQYRYYKAHFFDHFDFSEEGFLHSTYLQPKIDRYVDKMTAQIPDSVIVAVETVLEKSRANEKIFRFTLSHLLTKYHRPQVVGMDEVYVHIADKYYRTGIADWVSKEKLKKITDDAYMIKGVLIGNKAQNVIVQKYDYDKKAYTDETISLYDVQADYTVVFLWKPGCPHCNKMTEELKPFYEAYKNKGVEIFAISSATRLDLEKSAKSVEEKDVSWINTVDPNLKARALQKFYGTSLPKLYLLDKDKTIISSRIGVAQLPQVMEQHKNIIK